MKRLLISGAAVAAAVMALAACGGGSDDSSASGSAAAGTATVSTKDIGDDGTVLVDRAGKALYAADQETAQGMVLCVNSCLSFWKPLTVSGRSPTGDSVSGDLGVVKRPDGTSQVSLDGKLLYSFVEDQPGEVTGNGFQDDFAGQAFTWRVVHPDGSTGSTGTSSSGGLGY